MIYQEKELTQDVVKTMEDSLDGSGFFAHNGQYKTIINDFIDYQLAEEAGCKVLLPLYPPSKEEIEKKAEELYTDVTLKHEMKSVNEVAKDIVDYHRKLYVKFYTQALIDIGFKKEDLR